MEDNLTKKSQEILIEMGALEAYLLCPTDVTGIVGVLVKNARDREGHRRLLLVKIKGSKFGDRRKAECDHARKNGHVLPGSPRDRRVHEHEAEREKQILMSGDTRSRSLGFRGQDYDGGT